MDQTLLNAEEHQPISKFLELEQLDTKSFHCKWLWHPAQERGAYGGQIISQALLSATRCVDDAFAVHSIHCHFLSGADSSLPISYHVEQMREGKTYRTLVVKATQNGRWIFQAVCSFQRPEFNQPSHSWAMPRNVPLPDECPNQEDVFQRLAEKPGTRDEIRQSLLAQQRKVFPIATKTALSRQTEDGLTEDIFWMRFRAMPTRDAPFQKVVLAFLSDLNILATVARAVRLTRGAAPPHRLAMISSLDHSVWFYDNDFDCTEWMLFVMVSPLAGMGRGIVHGRIYTQQGRLIAMIAQEGVVRAEAGNYPKGQVARL